ncbi:hypothetical protein [Kitasatospora cathayae]|uniref:Uncharacterized protein n=1 Tax=Kitasatospora cathayae TaxID=3004092 RepID=A0ABY7QGR3_9ACTN|nr:hypothetical protein [Kitasatospora sp. HUAS 3-15]WBP91980.1 hypothetical protein O1G21_40020 [Kitasatospora sp. HUAS 3-15]
MFRLIRTSTWTTFQRRLLDLECELAEAVTILAVQAAGWTPPEPPVDGDLPAVLRHVDAGAREEAVCRAADFAERSFDPDNVLGLAMTERWTGYPDGSAVHHLGADRWLHYHPGRTKLRTGRAHYFPECERICLIGSRSARDVEPVASLPALLELLGGTYINYRAGQPA